MNITKTLAITGIAILCSGCGAIGNALNPFYEAPSEVAYFGEKNDRALNDTSGGKADRAREAFEQAGSYQRALSPQPVNPVVKPAVVRLMWIPDHLNSHGDLVPAHYYYVKVLKDNFAVTDAFELEAQLNAGTPGGAAAGTGFTLPEDLK